MRALLRMLTPERAKLDATHFLKPYLQRVKDALIDGDLETALAFLERAIVFAPGRTELHLMRGELLHYGFSDLEAALRDYRFVLDNLAGDLTHPHAIRAKKAIRDMVDGGC